MIKKIVNRQCVSIERVGTYRVEANFDGVWKIVFRGFENQAIAKREQEKWLEKATETGNWRDMRVVEYRGLTHTGG